MTFISYEFLIFFLVLLVLYWLAPERRWQNLLLFTASLFFYGWLVSWHAGLLVISIAIDYFIGLGMSRWKSKSAALMWVGIALNLVLLASVKYYFVYDETFWKWASRINIHPDFFVSSILLPLGTSFYTLKKISYLVDVQRGTMQPERDFFAFGAYVSFFPQVLSGPIDRPGAFLKQLEQPRRWSVEHLHNAWQLLLMGLFKKIVISNTVKVFVDQIFLLSAPSKVFLIVGGLGFTLQILADFSSYTDLSRGLAFLLDLKTSENFNRPYLALTPNDFWNRWHISFSSWLRDYIFFPVRRSMLKMKSLPAILSNIVPPLVTMFISGLWHGTGLTFILWGLYYGVLIVLYQLLGIRSEGSRIKRFISWLVMFVFIVIGWIIFRSISTNWLWNALTATPFANNTEELIASFVLLGMIAFYAALLYVKYLLDLYMPNQTTIHAVYYAFAIVLTIVFMNSSSPDFIYFQF